MDLSKKVAFVTGAARGIGKEIALVLASYGADIVAADLLKEELLQTVDAIAALDRNGIAVTLDVSQNSQVENAFNKAMDTFGRLDILVNAAGVQPSVKFEDMPEDVWDKNMDVNAKGTYLCCKAAVNRMKNNGNGKIINISSQASKIGEIGNGSYGCSKAAVNLLTQVLALEAAPYNINVNAICPGLIDTKMLQNNFVQIGKRDGLDPKQVRENLENSVPLKRLGSPKEVGDLVAFLASDKSDYITGISITIAGGTTLF